MQSSRSRGTQAHLAVRQQEPLQTSTNTPSGSSLYFFNECNNHQDFISLFHYIFKEGEKKSEKHGLK